MKQASTEINLGLVPSRPRRFWMVPNLRSGVILFFIFCFFASSARDNDLSVRHDPQRFMGKTVTVGVLLSVNPKTDFGSKNGFRVPFGRSKSGFLIW